MEKTQIMKNPDDEDPDGEDPDDEDPDNENLADLVAHVVVLEGK